MGRRAGGKDFAPRIRSMVDRVLEKMHDTGKAEELLTKAFNEDFVGTARAMAAYAPKQVDIDLEQNVSIDTTALSKDVLNEMFAIKEKREAGHDSQVH